MRLILDGSKNKTVSLAQDLESLKLYIELEMLRFGNNRFTYTIEINGAIHAERTQLPPMLIQPFVENAIWHGLQHKKTPGHIDIQFRKEKGYLICIIEDNGIGRKNSLAFKNENNIVNRKSYGIDITIERLALFNEEAASDSSSVQITDLEDKMKQAAGTRVALRIVLIETE